LINHKEIAKSNKNQVGKEFMKWLDTAENNDLWHTPGGLPEYKRRVLMTHWVAEAVATVSADKERMKGYFSRTGCMLAVDGSQDGKIRFATV
jgi:hypothetical protein